MFGKSTERHEAMKTMIALDRTVSDDGQLLKYLLHEIISYCWIIMIFITVYTQMTDQ